MTFLFPLLFLGFVVRLIMVGILPVWTDEKVALQIISHPYVDIFLHSSDAARPPLYYLFLKLWSTVSFQLVWLRLSSLVFYGINCLLLYAIGLALRDKYFGRILAAVYALSGYFVIFDWQVKPYTALLTSILLTIYLFQKKIPHLFLLFGSLLFGLFLDLGYLYFFVPTLLYVGYKGWIKNNILMRKYFALFAVAGLVLGAFTYFVPRDYGRFITGTAWVQQYMHPAFTIPYLFGLAGIPLAVIPVGLIWCVGYYQYFYKYQLNTIGGLILFCAFISYLTASIISSFWIPILHVRSLQIVALSLLFGIAYAICSCRECTLWERRFVYGVAFTLMALNLIRVAYQMTCLPGLFLVSFVQ